MVTADLLSTNGMRARLWISCRPYVSANKISLEIILFCKSIINDYGMNPIFGYTVTAENRKYSTAISMSKIN